jgi:hypothetical protein
MSSKTPDTFEEQFKKFTQDRRVIQVMRLARAASQIIYCTEPLQNKSGKSGRQLINSLLISSATLYEAVNTFNGLGELKGYKAYQDLSAILNGDPLIQRFLSHNIETFRNQLVFHFDDFVSPVLKDMVTTDSDLPDKEIPAIDLVGDVADVIAVHYFLQRHFPNWSGSRAFSNVYDKFIDSTNNFLKYTEMLIEEVFNDLRKDYPATDRIYWSLKKQFLG